MQRAATAFPSITVLVCTRDRPAQLELCLASLAALDYPDFEVLVVDSAPRDAAAFEVARQRGVRYLLEPAPGVSRARNVGVQASASDLVAMIDDDAVAAPDWLRRLAVEFEDPLVMAVAGRTKDLDAATPEERHCVAISSHDRGEERRVIDKSVPLWFERACFGGVGIGANMAFRRSAFGLWPGFCESLGAGTRIAGGEEHYAFFGLVDLGFRVVYAPGAIVTHPFPATVRAAKARQLKKLSASVAYVALLFFNEPQYRLRIVRYVLDALRGVRRTWRGSTTTPIRALDLSKFQLLRAAGSGLTSFALDRFGFGMRAVAGNQRRSARAWPYTSR